MVDEAHKNLLAPRFPRATAIEPPCLSGARLLRLLLLLRGPPVLPGGMMWHIAERVNGSHTGICRAEAVLQTGPWFRRRGVVSWILSSS